MIYDMWPDQKGWRADAYLSGRRNGEPVESQRLSRNWHSRSVDKSDVCYYDEFRRFKFTYGVYDRANTTRLKIENTANPSHSEAESLSENLATMVGEQSANIMRSNRVLAYSLFKDRIDTIMNERFINSFVHQSLGMKKANLHAKLKDPQPDPSSKVNQDQICPKDDQEVVFNAPSSAKYDWRVLSSDFISSYYDPNTDYFPWPGFPEADFFAAKFDPRQEASLDLSVDSIGGAFTYYIVYDDKGFAGEAPDVGGLTLGSNGLVDLWDSYTKVMVGPNEIKTIKVNHTKSTHCPDQEALLMPAYRHCLGAKIIEQKNYSGGGKYNGRSVAQEQQNIANWFTYHRTKLHVLIASIATIRYAYPDAKMAFTTINTKDTLRVGIGEKALSSVENILEFVEGVYDVAISGRTPLRSNLDLVGRYFNNGLPGFPSPITNQCQRNIALMMTDGGWNGDLDKPVGNVDGDPYSNTMADIAAHYYNRDLNPNLPNQLHATSFNSATHQHMNSAFLQLGGGLSLRDTDGDGWPNPVLAQSDVWEGDPSGKGGENKASDLWHAAYNSKGLFVAVPRAEQLLQGFKLLLAVQKPAGRIFINQLSDQ